jgi:hypothetical protein
MGKFVEKPKQKKIESQSGGNVYAAAAKSGLSTGDRVMSLAARAGMNLAKPGRSAAGSRAKLGSGAPQRATRGRSDVTQAALTDRKKKKTGQEAEASIIGSSGQKLGA